MVPPPVHPSPDGPPGDPADRSSLGRRVIGLCRDEGLFPSGCDAVVMVSGGQDSLALLHLLAVGALGTHGPRRTLALHVNHHLRGDDSEADQALVEERCRTLGVRLHVVDAPVDKRAGNVQAEARRGRREAARALLAASDAAVVALGHTLDDQVETLLYRLGRYGGLRALAGMRPNDPPWVRPLLGVRRAETGAYCRAHGLVYAVDAGNEYPGYVRTGLRQRVVPAWEEVLPGAAKVAGRSAEVASEAFQVVAERVDAVLSHAALPAAQGGEQVRRFLIARLLHLSPALRRAALHSVLEERLGEGVSRALVLDLEAFLSGPGQARLTLPEGWVAERAYGRLSFEPAGARAGGVPGAAAEEALPGVAVPLPLPGEAEWGGLVVAAEAVSVFRAHDPRSEAYFDAAHWEAAAGDTGSPSGQGRLWVRGVRPGDRMRPLGAPGSRSLQDILVDLKVPVELRSRIPVVGCGDDIVWLAGYVLADGGRIGPTTHRLVRLSVRKRGSRPGDAPPEGGVDEG